MIWGKAPGCPQQLAADAAAATVFLLEPEALYDQSDRGWGSNGQASSNANCHNRECLLALMFVFSGTWGLCRIVMSELSTKARVWDEWKSCGHSPLPANWRQSHPGVRAKWMLEWGMRPLKLDQRAGEWVHLNTSACMHVCLYMCICVYIYIYLCMNVCVTVVMLQCSVCQHQQAPATNSHWVRDTQCMQVSAILVSWKGRN